MPPGSHDIIDLDGDEDYTEFMESIAREIVQRQLTVPAIIFLETIKPLSFLGNQLLIFANPVVSLVVSTGNYYKFVRMIEDRENVEKLTVAIEEENAREVQRKKEMKEARRAKGGKSFLRWFRRGGDNQNKEVEGGGQQRDHQNNGD
ncbi:MAG: hypothetical protein R6U39_00610 [Candidatus Aegiribacteria sp.]